MRSLKGFILVAAVAASMILFGIAYGVTSWISRRYVQQDAQEQARFLAEQTFSSMFQVMRRGWDREDVEDFLDALERNTEGNRFAIEVFRGDLVEERFGTIDQPPLDPAVREAFRTGEPERVEEGNRLTFVHPLRAREECLQCHTNAAADDVLGVITVKEDLGPAIQAAREQFRTAFLLIALVPLGAAVGVAWFISRRIDRSVASLSGSIERVNTVSDLREVEQEIPDVGFAELNTLAAQVRELSSRLQGIAVDKDLLEFEIRLLEKFVITSDVVQDWRDYIKHLLREINGLIEAYSLFSLFKVDEELYDLEVFWIHPPSAETREAVTSRIHRAIADNPHFGAATEVEIHHNVADPGAPELAVSAEELDVQTKSLFLDSPKIGGIVGIGVNAATTRDPTRVLVTESILSTLLNVVGSVRAISKYTRDLEYYASRDPLTNLYNQRTFREFLSYEVGRAERHGYSFGLLVVDLDNFKNINDRFGHPLGDQFLQRFAAALHDALRDGDVWARYGGDEFVGLLPETGAEQAYAVAQRLLEAADGVVLDAPDGTRVRATVSVGIAMYPAHATDAHDLFLFADNMMYRAKTQGKHRIGMPTEEDVVEVFRELGEKSHLVQEAIDGAAVVPYYQPIRTVADGTVVAYEVLSRIHSQGEVLGAEEFIEHAERMGVVHKLDYLVMERAFADAREAGYQGLLFINLSPRALVLEEFPARIRELVRAQGMDPDRVVFELTERETVRNLNLLERFINDLKRDGFQFAVDDFGSGFSSFHYLKRLPIDYVKIEGEFVANMTRDPRDHAFVKSMATLAEELGIRTIAELIEEEEVQQAVREVGIPLGQGFLLGHPAPDLG
ncbi:MAG: putative bifunctional diguanylate cyclase/phosphodiesterase [Thiohalorhabdus sp.]|uniref:putative bifunctional diguanylate cyclase/phosphodiesterase n=1 Tax=Thiohalorhabdus sp. TaxID=3094134 RepID=UPI003980A0DF